MDVVPCFSGTVSGALSNAVGPSFGTICFGSFILTMVEMAKAAMERLRRQERGNILVCLLTACMECIYALIEYISKFATLQAAMTGDSFCDAAASVTDLLQRNFLTAYGTYAFPSMILQGAALVLAVGFGVATWRGTRPTHPVFWSIGPSTGPCIGPFTGFIHRSIFHWTIDAWTRLLSQVSHSPTALTAQTTRSVRGR